MVAQTGVRLPAGPQTFWATIWSYSSRRPFFVYLWHLDNDLVPMITWLSEVYKMVTLTWLHTRTGRPMVQRYATMGLALVVVMTVRTVVPGHPMQIDGKAV